MVRLYVSNSNNTELRGGPAVFMDRLSESLESYFSLTNRAADKYLLLGFRKDKINDDASKKIFRFDGVWNVKVSRGSPAILDTRFRQYANRHTIANYQKSHTRIFQSIYSQNSVEKLTGIFPGQNYIIYNGIDLERFAPKVASKSAENINICMVHLMWPSKRYFNIINFVEKLKNFRKNFIVHMVGNWPETKIFSKNLENKFRQEIIEKGIDSHFIFHGYVGPEKLPEIYQNMDVMLNFSFADPCPNVVVEALACGLPVICPNSGGIEELVRSNGDWVVEENLDAFRQFPVWDIHAYPTANVDDYVVTFEHILTNLAEHKVLAREYALKFYNIKNTVQQYKEVIGC